MKYKMIAALLNGSAEEQTKCLKGHILLKVM